MQDFQRETHTINGVKTVVYTAGQGEPLLFLHGAGTFHGFEFARAWTDRFRVILPYHPGFGESEDAPAMNLFQDYVMHYADFLDGLGLAEVNLVGFSLGGHIAAQFASQQGHRVKKLVLVGPAGMHDNAHPMADVLSLPPEELVGRLVANMDVLMPYLPKGPDPDFAAARYREMTTVARLIWEKPRDQKFVRYLHRVTMPTLVIWGEEDRLIPAQHAEIWRKFLPKADVRIFKDAGHLVLDERPEAARAVAEFFG